MDHQRRVVIGLGSNLGDRQANLDGAVARLRGDRDLYVLRLSPVYETAPEGGPAQGPYLNAAVLVVTALPGRDLLDRILAVEAVLGRVRTPVRSEPRTIDLDLLWIEGEAISEVGLQVPHPRLTGRAFALRPLLDVAPDAVDFSTGVAFASVPAASVTLTALYDARSWGRGRL